MSTKRRVGRPRKPNPFWRPDEDGATIKALFEHADIEPNITAETGIQFRGYAEEFRRERVSESVGPAFGEGRKVANQNRHRTAEDSVARAIAANDDLIKNKRLSISAVIKEMNKRRTTFGVGRDKLRRAIATRRESLLGQIEAKILT